MTAAATSSLWRVLAASVVGSGHLEREEPCQDAHAVAVTDDGLLVVAVADGAGSAARSAEGARAAVDAAVGFVLLCCEPDDDGAATVDEDAVLSTEQLLRLAVAFARDAVVDAAGEEDPRRLATTLAVVLVDTDSVATVQVGDGAVVVQRGEGFEVLGPVDRNEFLNETTFLTSADWEDELRIDLLHAADLRGVAAMTDGLQLLALDMASGTAHDGFFRPIFEWAAGEAGSDDELAGFLRSERVCARTDDDKTLVVAVPAPAGD